MLIDSHCHLPDTFTPKHLEAVFSLGFADQIWALSAPLTHWTGTSDNDDTVLKLARAFPGKVIPFGYLHLAKGPDWVDRQLERGFRGLKGHTPPAPWDHDSFFPIYERAQARGVPILFHTGQAWADTLDHYPYATSHRSRSTDWHHVERLDVVIKAFPSLTVIAAHLGWPHCEAALGMAHTHPNFHLDTSGYTGFILDWVKQGITTHGVAHKILLGTDVNLAGDDKAAAIKTWQERVHFWKHYFTMCFPQPPMVAGPTPADLILGGNARRILGD